MSFDVQKLFYMSQDGRETVIHVFSSPNIFEVVFSYFFWYDFVSCALRKVKGFPNSPDTSSTILPGNKRIRFDELLFS